MHRHFGAALPFFLALMAMNATMGLARDGESGSIVWRVIDEQGGDLPCQIYLKDAQQRPVRPQGAPFWHDHFSIEGSFEMSLPVGTYTYEIERGHEYLPRRDSVSVVAGQRVEIRVELKRLCNLRSHGWFSGDLHIHRPPADVGVLLSASDLDLGPVITWWNASSAWDQTPLPETIRSTTADHRWMDWMAGEDEREGGALLYFGLERPLKLKAESREVPSPMHFVEEARRMDPEVWIDIEKPFWWDLPTWVATGKMDSIGLAHNHMHREGVLGNEAWGRPRDTSRLPGPLGNGLWTQEIYYHLLNAGIQLPPSAGSASGVLENPVGYNRVYVHLDGDMTWESWFQGLRAGRCFVTNGPLIQATIDGHLSGDVLSLRADGPTEFRLRAVLNSVEPIQELEVIHRGGLIRRIPGNGQRSQEVDEVLTLEEPGWILVRVWTNQKETFRFASTAPWWIEKPGETTPISAESCRFFLSWLEERTQRIEDELQSEREVSAVLAPHVQAREFWSNRLQKALDQKTVEFPAVQATSQRRRLRVMSFNILQGGGNAANVGFYNENYGGSRLDDISAAILAADADIVGIQENGQSDLLLKELGPQWQVVGSIYSRLPMTPIRSSTWLSVARVHLSKERSIVVANCHWAPSPYGPFLVQDELKDKGAPQRLGEFRDQILAKSQKRSGPRGYQATIDEIQPWIEQGEVVVLTGDFNEPSHLDWTERAAREGVDRWVENSTKVPLKFEMPWEGSLLLQAQGLRDAYRVVFPNEVLRPGNTWTPRYAEGVPGRRPYGEQVLDRIDRIYYAGSGIHAVDAGVIGAEPPSHRQDAPGRWPSDHAAVIVEFDEQVPVR